MTIPMCVNCGKRHEGEWCPAVASDCSAATRQCDCAGLCRNESTQPAGVRCKMGEQIEMFRPVKPETEKHRASYLTVSQQFNLNVACRVLRGFGFGTYHVGSSLNKPDYHDIDLRCIMPDDEYDKMFSPDGIINPSRVLFLNTAISEWIQARTGLPIDFQFQRQTEANAEFKGPRNAVGIL